MNYKMKIFTQKQVAKPNKLKQNSRQGQGNKQYIYEIKYSSNKKKKVYFIFQN